MEFLKVSSTFARRPYGQHSLSLSPFAMPEKKNRMISFFAVLCREFLTLI
jgi:hypothetical protein